jgi:hypothetical protein
VLKILDLGLIRLLGSRENEKIAEAAVASLADVDLASQLTDTRNSARWRTWLPGRFPATPTGAAIFIRSAAPSIFC